MSKYQARIKNLKNENRSWNALCESEESALAWITSQIGKPGRDKEDISFEIIDLKEQQLHSLYFDQFKQEYPQTDNVIEVILEYGMQSDQFKELRKKAKDARQKYLDKIKERKTEKKVNKKNGP